jgi:hypothetical protein
VNAAPSCNPNGGGGANPGDPSGSGSSGKTLAGGSDGSNPAPSPVIHLKPGQLNEMRHEYGYDGPTDPTQVQLATWLREAYNQNGAWDFYCQNLMVHSTSACASNPYDGDKNIYASAILSTIDAPARFVNEHGWVGGSACWVICGGGTYQDETIEFSVGGLGMGTWAWAGGANAYTPSDTAYWSFGGCGSLGVGACINLAKKDSGGIRYGAGVTEGVGGYVGLMVTPIEFDFADQDYEFFGLKGHL